MKAYAGHWLTRRVPLAEGEMVLRTDMAFRFRIIAWVMGILTLTSERLIWTPFPMPWGYSRWTATKSDVTDVSVHRYVWWAMFSPWARWAAEVKTARKSRRFVFGGILPEGSKSRAESWVKAIAEWANLSA